MSSSKFQPTLFPSEKITLKSEGSKDYIFDTVRKKWLVLTPEEWVRQHIVLHLLDTLNYPPSSIAIEKVVEINGMPKRFDVLVYVNAEPAILIECKAPNVAITEGVFHQACRYNASIKAPFAALFNGEQLIVAQFNTSFDQFGFVPQIPSRDLW